MALITPRVFREVLQGPCRARRCRLRAYSEHAFAAPFQARPQGAALQRVELLQHLRDFDGIVGAADAIDVRSERRDLGRQHALLDRAAGAPDASRNSRRPRPSSRRVSCTSPAISPHTAIGTFGLVGAPPIASASRRSTAGCSGIVEVRHRVVGAIDGERVLDQVVGADRQEVELARRTRPIASTAAGISIMPPTSICASNGTPCSRSASFACSISRSVWSISPDDASIGIRMRTLAVVRRAQDRAELREEEARLGQAEAHRAQAQRRVGRDAREAVQSLLVLVGAEVERADRHRPPLHARGHRAVRLELLVLGRQALAIEEQELGAEQADAGRRRSRAPASTSSGSSMLACSSIAHAVERLRAAWS